MMMRFLLSPILATGRELQHSMFTATIRFIIRAHANPRLSYYINPPGISHEEACVWGTKEKPIGNVGSPLQVFPCTRIVC